ncbi:MAG: uroporphyrinogen decarboxylase family protein [Christensenellales bacterium]|jgi:uroporphyrinogen decarboxylase
MNSRERVRRAMHYRSVDKVPLQYYYTPVGYYEHGEKLNDLYASLPGDFEPYRRMPIPKIAESCYDIDGRYHELRRDEWGVVWEYRIFGVAGIPKHHPISSPEEMMAYRLPPDPADAGEEFDAYARQVRKRQEDGFYTFGGAGSLYEILLALYGDENVLCDIALDEPAIHDLADRLMRRGLANVRRSVKAGADGIALGDDYGTERGMILSPKRWREFFKPRMREMLEPAAKAGLDIHFHSCGNIMPILEDLREVGITSIWPQLPAYDMKELADRCCSLGLAVAIHTDRARTMTSGTPQQVRDLVRREFDIFRMTDGGSWFYIEADNGFPFENLAALVETVAQWR